MMRWTQFAKAEPEMARLGLRLLFNKKDGEVGILATVNKSGHASASPVCPIFCDEGIYLLVGRGTPKKHHLCGNGSYALHAQVGSDDLEFQIRGSAREVHGENERAQVIASIPFSSFDKSDPIFELLIKYALTVSWPTPGVQDKRTFVDGSRGHA
ncbi:MAG: pyridoxamine 5'-phosphate oxidase family protein [Proteobacteria bacterium]|nr:pyridoxamine 5'-phosphate oxidase family protein [Pseudomonadota bacterium]